MFSTKCSLSLWKRSTLVISSHLISIQTSQLLSPALHASQHWQYRAALCHLDQRSTDISSVRIMKLPTQWWEDLICGLHCFIQTKRCACACMHPSGSDCSRKRNCQQLSAVLFGLHRLEKPFFGNASPHHHAKENQSMDAFLPHWQSSAWSGWKYWSGSAWYICCLQGMSKDLKG